MKNEPTHANLQVCLQIFGLRNKQLELIKTSEKFKIMLEESMEYIDFEFIRKQLKELDLKALAFGPTMPKILPGHCQAIVTSIG